MFDKFFGKWENDRLEKRFYQMLTICLVGLLLISIMGTVYVAKNTRIVLIPATLDKSIWVSASTASDDYFGQMAIFFAGFRLNFSPQTVDFQFKNLLQYVSPESSGILSGQLSGIAADIKGKNFSEVFIPGEVRPLDPENHAYVIKGMEKHFIGSQMVEEVPKEYQIVFQLNNGKIYVSSFKDYTGQKVADVNGR